MAAIDRCSGTVDVSGLALTRFDQSPSGTTRVVALKGLSVFARLFGWIRVAGSQDSGGGIAMATA
jgi:hypothetical protein